MRKWIRFTRQDRLEHWLVALCFLLLVWTGLPQKYYGAEVSQWIIAHSGGIDYTRLLHRVVGFVFTALTVWHVGSRVWGFLRKKIAPSMLPTKRDFTDAITNLRYYMGLTDHEARCDRFDYKQKFEYWGMLMGSAVMIATGLLLYAPAWFTQWLPGVLIPAAKVAHSNEAMLALLVIVVWHLYGVVFSPEVFPLDTSMFTGNISEERMKKEHPLEYERLQREAETPPLT
ncbi:MAG: cytochrome b/b6 domain-containing protein [Deltaproteobacteria bacterium]|nr:cytochrome b/b6 domain-containing protein [Deltaproteobacteria bacterium]